MPWLGCRLSCHGLAIPDFRGPALHLVYEEDMQPAGVGGVAEWEMEASFTSSSNHQDHHACGTQSSENSWFFMCGAHNKILVLRRGPVVTRDSCAPQPNSTAGNTRQHLQIPKLLAHRCFGWRSKTGCSALRPVHEANGSRSTRAVNVPGIDMQPLGEILATSNEQLGLFRYSRHKTA